MGKTHSHIKCIAKWSIAVVAHLLSAEAGLANGPMIKLAAEAAEATAAERGPRSWPAGEQASAVIDARGHVVTFATDLQAAKLELWYEDDLIGDSVELLADEEDLPVKVEFLNGVNWVVQAFHVDGWGGLTAWSETTKSCYHEWHGWTDDTKVEVIATSDSGATARKPLMIKVRPRTQG